MPRIAGQMPYCAVTAVVGVIVACAGDGGRTQSRDSTSSASPMPPARSSVVGASNAPDVALARTPVVILIDAADTQHVFGSGVPTAPDDTLGTQYGKHWGPPRMLAAPPCRP